MLCESKLTTILCCVSSFRHPGGSRSPEMVVVVAQMVVVSMVDAACRVVFVSFKLS
jgi:hypothetical protein